MADIFKSQPHLRPSQLKAVAERRFDDACALCDTRKNKHANGAQYLCGFTVEILLKAGLLLRYPGTESRNQQELRGDEHLIWTLIWRSHNLVDMLERLPELEAALVREERRDGVPYARYLKEICARWTIQARYSTQTSTIAEAREMIARVRKLKELLK